MTRMYAQEGCPIDPWKPNGAMARLEFHRHPTIARAPSATKNTNLGISAVQPNPWNRRGDASSRLLWAPCRWPRRRWPTHQDSTAAQSRPPSTDLPTCCLAQTDACRVPRVRPSAPWLTPSVVWPPQPQPPRRLLLPQREADPHSAYQAWIVQSR